MKRLILIFIFLFIVRCSSSDAIGAYVDSNNLAVDSVNDRLFITEPGGVLFTLTASERVAIGAQPIVDEDVNADINLLMPVIATHFGVFATGATSRLFLMGAFLDENDDFVLNRVRVLDFDGADFTEASFSPLILSDGDDATDERDNSFSELLLDQDNGYVFVTDAGAGLLYVLNASTGTAVTAPIAIVGSPQGMALDNNRLYVCNSSSLDVEQVITVVNVADFTTTTIDVDIPCRRIAVASTASGTAMLVRRSSAQQVLIHQVDTATYAASSAIAAATSGFASGSLSAGVGISSEINDMVLNVNSTGTLSGYLSEEDGNIEFVTIAADLGTYSIETLSAVAVNITHGDVFKSTDGIGTTAYFVSGSGYLVTVDVGSTDVDLDN